MTPSSPLGSQARVGLDPEEKHAFSQWLKEQGDRPLRHRNTRENIVSYIDGYQRLGGTAESVADIQEAAGFPQGRRKGPLFGLIAEGSWEGDAVRVLAHSAALDRPDALAIDLCECRSGGSAYEVLLLSSVLGEERSPLDSCRVRIESEEAEDDVEGRCRQLALKLVDGFRDMLSDIPGSGPASKLPVIATQQALAENSPLRPELADRGIEYALGVTTEYHARVSIDPRASPFTDGTLPEIVFLEPHGAVRHRNGVAVALRDIQLGSRGPFLDEHLVQIGDPGGRYFVARGRLEAAPRLPAYRLARRSIEIAEIAARLPAASLADLFGVASFSQLGDRSWRRHMLLLSLYKRFRLENE